MQPTCHQDATFCGDVGTTLCAGPIQQLCDWKDQHGPGTGHQVRMARIALLDPMATVRLAQDHRTGGAAHSPDGGHEPAMCSGKHGMQGQWPVFLTGERCAGTI